MTYSATSPVFAPSRVSVAVFTAFLRAKRSPAAVEASAIHAVLGQVDPAVALGQFGAESSFGTAGYAKITRNWGNIAMATPGTPKLLRAAKIATHWSRRFGAKPYSPGNGYTYASFPTWRDGARAYTALMNTYRLRGWAPSIQAMCRKWLGGIGTGYIANIVRIANAVPTTRPAPTPVPPPVVVPSPPALPPIPTTPERIEARQPTLGPAPYGFMRYGFGVVVADGDWVARPLSMPSYEPVEGKTLPVFVLVHGGPIGAAQFGGMENLANWLATQGAIAIVPDYPTRIEDGATNAPRVIAEAIARTRAKAPAWGGDPSRITLVAHSLGGFFASLIAYGIADVKVDRLVLIAADDQVGREYRMALGLPDPRVRMASNRIPVTVIAASADPITTVAELQAVVNALHTTGHPGRWLVIDDANHDSILSDVGAIAAVLDS